jgi:hypothetical protein
MTQDGVPLKSKFKDILYWQSICKFLRMEENAFMRPYVCVPCKFCILYDKYDKPYRIRFGVSREEVEAIINNIKSINAAN